MRAATRVNAEQTSKRTMCEADPTTLSGKAGVRLGEMSDDDAQPLHRGSGGSTHDTQGKRTQHGKPQAWPGQGMTQDQPDAREGQAEALWEWRRGGS